MTRHRAGTLGRTALMAVTLWLGLACDKPAPARSNDTAAPTLPPPPPPDSQPAVVEAPWDSSAGPVFLVVGQHGAQGSVVFPQVAPDVGLDTTRLDPTSLRGTQFDLLANGRVAGRAALSGIVPVEIPEDCSAWPTVQLAGEADSSARGWAVAFPTGRAVPIAFDSLAGLPSRDSSRLAIDLARVASALPGDTVPELKGIPYTVRHAYRFVAAPGVEGIIAEVLRTLNQEASPKQEHLLVIAERDSALGASARLVPVYAERTSGGEEMLESSELLALARFGAGGRPVAIIARYLGDGVVYALLERVDGGRWRLRWSSPYAGC